MRPKIFLQLLVILAVSLSSILATSFAQTPQKKRPKLKDFGSSLKNPKWDPTKKAALERKRSGNSNTRPDEDDVVRIETNLVTCSILVVDRKGNVVTGLTADDFSIAEDGVAQKVEHFLLGDNVSVPRTIVLIIDYSGSQFPFIRNSVDAAKLMVDKLTPRDRMAIVTDDIELLVDFTDDKVKLKEKLESLVNRHKNKSFVGFGPGRRFGKSAQYSALMATLNEAFLEEDLRPIIIFQTDGDEIYKLRDPIIGPSIPPDLPDDVKAEAIQIQNAQRRQQFGSWQTVDFSLADIYRAAEKSSATIYTVIPGFRLLNKTPEEQIELMRADVQRRTESMLAIVGQDRLKANNERWRVYSPTNLAFHAKEAVTVQTALAAVAPRTGGWTEFLEKPEEAEGIYNRIFADINLRYIIGYYPTNKEHDGKRRKLKFEVRGHPDYYIIGRDSYYAPGVR